ncbi:TPA: tail assembly chaperone, partial [Staphylococcus aureus]
MTEFNPITTLKINDGEKDYEVEAKVSFAFDQKAEKFSQET